MNGGADTINTLRITSKLNTRHRTNISKIKQNWMRKHGLTQGDMEGRDSRQTEDRRRSRNGHIIDLTQGFPKYNKISKTQITILEKLIIKNHEINKTWECKGGGGVTTGVVTDAVQADQTATDDINCHLKAEAKRYRGARGSTRSSVTAVTGKQKEGHSQKHSLISLKMSNISDPQADPEVPLEGDEAAV